MYSLTRVMVCDAVFTDGSTIMDKTQYRIISLKMDDKIKRYLQFATYHDFRIRFLGIIPYGPVRTELVWRFIPDQYIAMERFWYKSIFDFPKHIPEFGQPYPWDMVRDESDCRRFISEYPDIENYFFKMKMKLCDYNEDQIVKPPEYF